MTKVFVYGSLLSGLSNHHRLQEDGVEYLGVATTVERYSLSSCGPFPILNSKNQRYRVLGEVYNVTPSVLASLDALEAHPFGYVRQLTNVELHDDPSLNPSDLCRVDSPAVPCREDNVISVYMYYGDLFWDLEGHETFEKLSLPDGDWRRYFNSTDGSGYLSDIPPPHPITMDEPVLFCSGAMEKFLHSHSLTRFLGKCSLSSSANSNDQITNAFGEVHGSVFCVAPILLLQLDRLLGHTPGSIFQVSEGERVSDADLADMLYYNRPLLNKVRPLRRTFGEIVVTDASMAENADLDSKGRYAFRKSFGFDGMLNSPRSVDSQSINSDVEVEENTWTSSHSLPSTGSKFFAHYYV